MTSDMVPKICRFLILNLACRIIEGMNCACIISSSAYFNLADNFIAVDTGTQEGSVIIEENKTVECVVYLVL